MRVVDILYEWCIGIQVKLCIFMRNSWAFFLTNAILYKSAIRGCGKTHWTLNGSKLWMDVVLYALYFKFCIFVFLIQKCKYWWMIPLKWTHTHILFRNMTCLGSHEVRTGGLEPLSSTIQVVKISYFSIAPKSFVGLETTLLGGQVCV